MKVLFTVGYQNKPFSYTEWKKNGTGGSEYCVINLADKFSRNGHEVYVTGQVKQEIYNNVKYIDYRNLQSNQHFDVVIASRFLKKSDRYFNDANLDKEINENQSYLFNKLCKILLFKDINDYTSGYVCIKKKILNNYSLKGYYGDYFVDMIVELKKQKANIIEIPFKDALRASGNSKTVVTINFKYLYTCFRYLITLIKSYFKNKF